jgi:hypothetical protein
MTPPADKRTRAQISEELRPYVDAHETRGINALGEWLLEAKPVPRAGFRAELNAHLREQTQAPPAWRPQRLGRLVAAYAGSGVLLMVVAAIGLAGAGPLGY